MLCQVTIIGVFIAQSECRCSSSSLAGDLGCCLARRLVVWLIPLASALHAHVVNGSLIAVLAVVSIVHILREYGMFLQGFSQVLVSLVLCWITWIPLLSPYIIFNPDFIGRFCLSDPLTAWYHGIVSPCIVTFIALYRDLRAHHLGPNPIVRFERMIEFKS